MDRKESWLLIARHLTGTATPGEEQALKAWASGQPGNQRVLDEATHIWELTGKHLPMPELEVAEEWKILVQRIERQKGINASPSIDWYRRVSTPLKIAAVLVFSAVLYLILRPGRTPELSSAPKLTVLATSDSVRAYLLPDSSQVWLNVNSTLTFDSAFLKREVILSGEGYFQVRHNSTQTHFVVLAREARITVVGTSFDAQANDDSVGVVVVTGKVELAAIDSARTGKVLLGPNDRGIYRASDSTLTRDRNSDPSFLSWTKRNNPVYEYERKNARKFIAITYHSRKNVINQTVIEGQVTNTAEIASYNGIKLKIRAVNARGKITETIVDIGGGAKGVPPGKTITFKRTFFDVLSAKPNVAITVENVKTVM